MDLEQMVKDVLKNTSPQAPVEPEPAEVSIAESWSPRIKGEPKRLFDPAAGLGGAANALSDFAVDMRHYNAAHVDIIVTGSSPSATISVEGSTEEGGFSQTLSDVEATKAGLTASKSFDVLVGAAWLRVRIAAISGTYGAGQGFTVTITPFVTGAVVPRTGELLTLLTSAARTDTTANNTGSAITGLTWRNRYIIVLNCTSAATEAGDTLDVYIDVTIDGTTWLNAVHFTQILGNGGAKKEYAVLDPSAPGTSTIAATSDAASGVVRPSMFGAQMRVRWTIVDVATLGNQSFTFGVTAFVI